MKYKFTSGLITLFLFSSFCLLAQTIKVPLSKGGIDNGGTILQVNTQNGNYVVSKLPGLIGTKKDGNDSGSPVITSTSSVFYESSNNSLYIVAKEGFKTMGDNEPNGVIFRYSLTDKNTYLIKEFFDEDSLGSFPFGDLQKIGNSLYGTVQRGGASNFGGIFSIDLSNDNYSLLHSFNGTTEGGKPSCSLFADGNDLYGAGIYGNGSDGEVYFKYDVNTSSLTTLFIDNLTINDDLRGVFKRNNTLYISKGFGIEKLDLNNPSAGRTTFFTGSGSAIQIGTTPWNPSFITGSGNWYVALSNGGLNSFGSVCSFDFGSQTLTNIHNFQGGSLGQGPETTLINGLNGSMIGLASTGVGDNYVLFQISNIGVYSVLHEFNSAVDGVDVTATPTLVGSKVYGISESKGQKNGGTIWSFDFANSQFSVEAQLGYETGKAPVSGLVVNPANQNLSFTCFQGPAKGTVNVLNTDNTISKIVDLTSSGIENIYHKPIFYNGKTYLLFEFTTGLITSQNATYGIGELDNTNGSVSNVVPVAPASTIADIINTIVVGNIVQDGNTVYGVSLQNIWSVDLSTNTNNTAYTFNTSVDGNTPTSIILDNNILYGINEKGGANNTGTIFSFDFSTSTYSVIQDIPIGESFHGIQKDSNHLYSINYDGTSVYSVAQLDLSVATPSFQNIASIDPTAIGTLPGDNLSVFNGFLYGIMNSGGQNNLGGLYKFEINTNTLSNIISFDDTTGHFAYNSELLLESSSIGLDENEQNHYSLAVYPNPTTGLITLEIPNSTIEEVYVMDINGKIIFETKGTHKIDLSTCAKGVYFIKVISGNKTSITKVVKK